MRQLLKLRRSGAVSYADITDGTRWITRPDTYDEPAPDARRRRRVLPARLWHDQRVDVHLYTEKDAISGVILPVTDRRTCRSACSAATRRRSFAWSVARSLQPTTGRCTSTTSATTTRAAWTRGGASPSKVHDFAPDADVTFTRLAVTPEQIEEMRLPTRPTKSTDSRSRGFRGGSVEVDAIPAPALRELVEDAIEQHIDPDALRLTRMAEDNERRVLLAMRGTAGP